MAEDDKDRELRTWRQQAKSWEDTAATHKANWYARGEQIEQLYFVIAALSGELTEGAAAACLDIDRLAYRAIQEKAVKLSVLQWEMYRRHHPAAVEPQ